MDAIPRTTSTLYGFLVIGWLVTCSACAPVSVSERDPIAQRLPECFIGFEPSPSKTRLTWEESFPSLRLRADIESLMDENLELAAARARVEQAAAAFGIAKAALYPSLDATVSADRSRVKEDQAGGSTTTRNTISLGGALNWELDVWGRLRALKEAAALSFEEKQALVSQTELDLQTLLVENWIVHHGARHSERVLLAQQRFNKQFLDLTELRLAEGQGSALDVLQQRGRLAATQRSLPEMASRRRRTANAYAVLMGRFPDGSDLAEDRWPEIKRLGALPSPRQLLSDRPDLRAAFFALQAADHEVAAAVADRLPRLSIGLTAVESGHSVSSIGDGSLHRIAGDILAPVFDAGRRRAIVDQREAEARETLAVLERALRAAVREVEDAISQERALFEEGRLLKKEIDLAVKTVEKATLRYVNGQESFLAVLAALVKQQSLEQREITNQQGLLINRSRLLNALGAQWSDSRERP